MLNDPVKPDPRAAIGLTRRCSERYAVDDLPISTIWLHDWQTVEARGTLIDISSGGLGVRMQAAPSEGHLLHARLPLPSLIEERGAPLEMDARVCGRNLLNTPGDEGARLWHVHLAIESMHPADEKAMRQALHALHASKGPSTAGSHRGTV